MKKSHIFKSIYVYLVLLISFSNCQDTIDLLCGDTECKKIVAEAITVMKFNSVDKNVLSFRGNDRVRIMGRNMADGPKLDYVLVEISGRRGWAPARMLKETRILVPSKQLMPTKMPSPFAEKKTEPPKPVVPPAEPPTEAQPEEVVKQTPVESVVKPDAKDLSEEDEELTASEEEELKKLFNETMSGEVVEDMILKEAKSVSPAPEVVDTTLAPAVKVEATVVDDNATLPVSEQEQLIANVADMANETLPTVKDVPMTPYSVPQEPVEASTPVPGTVPSLEPVQVVEIPPQPTAPVAVEQAKATEAETTTTQPPTVSSIPELKEPIVVATTPTPTTTEKVVEQFMEVSSNETEETIVKIDEQANVTEAETTTTQAPNVSSVPELKEPTVEATTPTPTTTEKIAEIILEVSSNETEETIMKEPEVVTEKVVEVTKSAPKIQVSTAKPEEITTTTAPIEVVTTPSPVDVPVTTPIPVTEAPTHQHHHYDPYAVPGYTTPSPVKVPVTPVVPEVPVHPVTPPPVTPTPHHHHDHDHHGHDYLKVETTTQSLPKVEDILTTTPAPPPQLEPKGMGSVVELTGFTPEVTTTPAPTTEMPQTEENPVEAESFLTSMWSKVSGLFGGGDADGSETTTESSFDEDLHNILFSGGSETTPGATTKDEAFCARFTTDPECAKMRETADRKPQPSRKKPSGGIKHPLAGDHHHHNQETSKPKSESLLSNDTEYIQIIFEQLIEMIDLIVTLALTALVVLIFILGYYCINKSRREGPLLAKINGLERHLMASLKESSLLKAEVLDTRNKLVSIEDNSFGSNDMVIALRKELDGAEQANLELQDQVDALEKELENAAEAGLELNKMVSELLSNQTGSDSIISSVEELQRQLNEQQETIVSMNSALALKSRENSELQILIGEQNNRLQQQFEELQGDYDQLKLEKVQAEAELKATQRSQNDQIREITENMDQTIQRLSDDVEQYKRRYVEADAAKRLSATKVEALETCVAEMKNGVTGELGELMDVAELKADLLAVTKEKDILRESLDGEADARRLLEERVRVVNEEVSQLKKDYTKAEQEKTATETRLEILSSYFKEKEAQLQKELSIKEEKVLQKQGETTSTVERLRAMQDEIQSLKSQNDALRAEIEAQSAANKQQNVNLENRAHEAWLSARQAERKLEEARSEASALRRKLTSMAEVPGGTLDSLTDMPSPIRVESPSHPNVPPPMMMPPFMPPPPFGLPPPPGMPFMPPPGIPPFMPGGDMRSGRLMSPPPPNNRYSPGMRDRDYSPDRYSPDSRYNYSEIYETETDFSPPPSPPPRQNYGRDRDYRDGPGRGGAKKAYSPPPTKSATNRSSKTKGVSSGSQDSIGGLRKGGK